MEDAASSGFPTGLVFLGAVVMAGLWAVSIYNGLVRARNHFKNAFAQIDVQLKRRYDLIPNLVETVKGYMKHEEGTLTGVIEARNAAASAMKALAGDPTNAAALQSLGKAEGLLGNALGALNVAFEAYPDLKADTQVQNLMEELTSTENKVGFSRQAFNDSVTSYNNAREVFPASMIAGIFGFGEAALLDIEFKEGERDAPKVSF